MEKYTFLDDYWKIVGENYDARKIKANRHFKSLNDYLLSIIKYRGIPEDSIACLYSGKKKWDMHFPDTKIAVEYKTMTEVSVGGNRYNRIEEAIGSSINLKDYDSDYKTGYILVFAFARPTADLIKKRDVVIDAFDKIVKSGYYDYFCALQTNGIGKHVDPTTKYSFDKFIAGINKKTTVNSDDPINKNIATLHKFLK